MKQDDPTQTSIDLAGNLQNLLNNIGWISQAMLKTVFRNCTIKGEWSDILFDQSEYANKLVQATGTGRCNH